MFCLVHNDNYDHRKLISDITTTLIIFSIAISPLALFHYPLVDIYVPNLADEVFFDRVNQMFVAFVVFHLGQLLYLSSFLFIKPKSFFFEFFGRLFVCMSIQSFVYYVITAIVVFSSGTILLFPLLDLIFNGFIVRFGLLILASPLFYLVFKHLKKSKTLDATIS